MTEIENRLKGEGAPLGGIPDSYAAIFRSADGAEPGQRKLFGKALVRIHRTERPGLDKRTKSGVIDKSHIKRNSHI